MNLKGFSRLLLGVVFCGVLLGFGKVPIQAQSGSVGDAFFADMKFLSDNTLATLLFVPFPSNPDFTKHNLSDASVSKICATAKGATSGNCGNVGVNFGTVFRGDFYQKARQFGMNWTLEIADAGNQKDVIEAINLHGVSPNTVIVRFGVVGNGIGANQNPESVIGFLEGVGKSVGNKEFYAIAGPNEPDLETWAAPDCGQAPGQPDDPADPTQTAAKKYFECVGPKLAAFMNAVCAARPSRIPNNVKLLSPAFNMTSYSFNGIIESMKKSGANFGCVDAIAGNLYPLGKSVSTYWADQKIGEFLTSVGKQLIITETGPISGDGGTGTGGNKVPGYSKTPFPPYEADPLDYYLQPLKGLAPNASVSEVRQDLAFQGYQAYCATPRYAIDARYNTEDLIDRFLRSNTGVLLTVSSKFEMNTQNSLYPLFRDVEGNRWLTNSIEEFWGFTDTETENYTTAELNTAPVNSLLNQTQRCTQSVKTLYAIDEMCQKLEDPETCTLYTRKIPSTQVTTKELLERYKATANNAQTSETIAKACEKIIADPLQKTLKEQLLITPLNIDRSYRLGFLVASIKQSRDTEDKVFNLLSINKRGGGRPGTPPHEVLVVAFKLPDILTNKGEVTSETSSANAQKKSGSSGWNDAALLTRNILLPQSKIEKAEAQGVQQRIETLKRAEERATQGNDDAIQCVAGATADGSSVGIGSSLVCKDPLGKAVVDIVNAYRPDCVTFKGKAETSSQIDDPAGLQIRNAPIFNDPFGRDLLKNLFMSLASEGERNQIYPQQRFDQGMLDFISNFRVAQNSWWANRASDSTIDFYLVYPVGYDLEQVEKTVSGTFFTTSQLEVLSRDQYNKEFFEMNTDRQFSSGTASHSFGDQTETCTNSLGATVACLKTFTVSIASGGYERVKVLGGRLGYWMRTIQRELAPLASEVQKYWSSCRTTEEFLLGRCNKNPIASPDTRSEVLPSFCGTNQLYISNSKTDYYKMCEKIGGDCTLSEANQTANFLDENSPYSLQVASRIIDGATLVTTNTVVAMNPAQNFTSETSFSRCGKGPKDMSAVLQVWYLPASTPPEKVNSEDTWNNQGSRLITQTGTDTWTNLTLNLKVKPGYYLLRGDTHGCVARETIWSSKGGTSTNERFRLNSSVIPVGFGDTPRESYCAMATFNSNMPGGPSDSDTVEMDKSFECSLAKKYNITLNNSCGGLNGSGDLNLWRKLFEPDDEGGSNKLPGLGSYEKIFGRKFAVPGGSLSCDLLFPNTIREVSCDQVGNGDVDGSIGEIPEFSIARWKHQGNNKMLNPEPGAMTTFKLPGNEAYRSEILQALNSASAKHQCDPLLILAVLHSESGSFTNHDKENGATAMGIAQATRGAWGTWWTPGCHQPPSFTPANPRPELSQRTDVNLALDFVCRHILWTNIQAYPENRENFIINFALQWKPEYKGVSGGNVYGQIWNIHTPQADYVYRLWKELRERTGKAPMTPPTNYPGNQCG